MAAFGYLVGEVRCELAAMAAGPGVGARHAQDPTGGQCSVANFVARIEEQCVEALAAHGAVGDADYANDGVFRRLVSEMAQVKVTALSKFRGWLENGAAEIRRQQTKYLRTAHREYVTYLEKTLPRGGAERREAALALCRIKGLIERSVAEKNQLGETRLMNIAAEGGSAKDLRLLQAAGADLHEGNVGGFSPVYAAAKYGHADCVRMLGALGADVNRAMPDTVTPLFVAAQHGHADCVEVLAALGADLNAECLGGDTPLQAARRIGASKCVAALLKLGADPRRARGGCMTPPLAVAPGGVARDSGQVCYRCCADVQGGTSELVRVGAEKMRELRGFWSGCGSGGGLGGGLA